MVFRILLVEIDSKNPQIDKADSVFSAPSLFDYDLVVVDLDAVFGPLENKLSKDQFLSVETNEGQFIQNQMKLRSKESELLMRKGGTLACFLKPRKGITFRYWDVVGEHTPQVTNLDWLPIYGLSYQTVSGYGKMKKLCEDVEHFAPYLIMNETYWSAYLEYVEGLEIPYRLGEFDLKKRVLALNEGGKAIAAEFLIGKGRLIVLPPSDHENTGDIVLKAIVSSLKGSIERSIPSWMSQIKVPNEEIMRESLDQLMALMKKTSQELESHNRNLEETTFIKKLLYEKNEQLEEAVKKSFEELGFTLVKKSDKDWVGNSDVGQAILEVTGSDGSVDIDKLRQLLNYLIDDYKESKIESKAILVGNHYANDSPETRGEPFTEKVVRESKIHNMCLLPTTELFAIVCDIRDGKIDAQEIRKKIIGTTGVFER